jgi:hypothetical protein
LTDKCGPGHSNECFTYADADGIENAIKLSMAAQNLSITIHNRRGIYED